MSVAPKTVTAANKLASDTFPKIVDVGRDLQRVASLCQTIAGEFIARAIEGGANMNDQADPVRVAFGGNFAEECNELWANGGTDDAGSPVDSALDSLAAGLVILRDGRSVNTATVLAELQAAMDSIDAQQAG